jgi:uncharacterized protein
MRMDDQGESQNVEDVRGSSGGFRPIHGIGLGSIVLAIIAGAIFHINPLQLLGLMSTDQSATQSAPQQPVQSPPATDPDAKFVSQVLKSTETVWTDAFQERGQTYTEPKLRLFRDSYPTACGQGSAAAGPFYCPEDRDAYVIGHEVGHHVQNLLGILGKINTQRERSSEAQANALSVRIELQADCFAGVWANRSQKERGWRLESGDIESALNAASRIGDDTLQRQSRGMVVPETFTHGTSAQRVSWFKRGVSSGQIDACDTFGAAQL